MYAGRTLPAAALVVLAGAFVGRAATFHVPSDFSTIQEAINHTVGGDSVLVAPGTYSGTGNQNIDFSGKNVTLRSEAGPEVTIIHLTGAVPRRGVLFQSGESLARLEGFTIQGGYASWGGAVLCTEASPTLVDCRLLQNLASFGPGGAIFCQSSVLTVIDCVFGSNSSIDFAAGGAIYADQSTVTIRGCTISHSEAAFGAQIDLAGQSFATIENTVLSFGHQGAVGCRDGSSATLSCCDVFGNAYGDWIGCIASQYGVRGNFWADPLFCDTAGLDYRLRAESPCLPPNNTCGVLVGALGVGCGTTSVSEALAPLSWGLVKSAYRLGR